MTPGTVRRMTLAVGLGLLLALALASTVALAQGGSPPSGGYDYTVQPGDSWLTLSGRTNIPIADLKAANPAVQHPYGWLWQGERLFIPARAAPPPGQQASTTPSATAAGYWYQVQKGDTWQTVARASGVPMLDLWHANPLQLRPNRWLYIGHRLWIPKAAATSAPATAGAPAAIAAPVATATRALTPTVKASPTVTPTVALTATQVQPLSAATVTPTKAVVSPAATLTVAVTATKPVATAVATTTQPAIGIVVTATKPTAPPPTSTPPSLAGWPADVLTLINEKRVAAGVPPLVWSPVLARVAQAHADDCAQRGWGSHVGSDGALLQTRLAEWAMRPRRPARFGPRPGTDGRRSRCGGMNPRATIPTAGTSWRPTTRRSASAWLRRVGVTTSLSISAAGRRRAGSAG